ncbi:MAG TPA: flagellar basal body P-ring protein FlgI [Pirellulaceae bacterium]|jgi:flagellar basal body P-ring protein FlgI|nr:flagellar basal body P-ring protein FlgI [Pirellulaceae bacterium]
MARRFARFACLFFVVAFASSGCTSPWSSWSGSSWWGEDESTLEGPSEETLAELRKKAKRVGELTYAWNFNFQKVEGVALVTELDRTGSSPAANALRARLRKEMQTHKITDPDTILDSDKTSLVLVKGALPPAAKRGDRIDLVAVVPDGSETTSLEGGWMMSVRMRQMAVLDRQLREGEVLVNAEGSVLVDALFEEDSAAARKLKGRVLGAGEVQRDREIGLQIRSPDLKGSQAIIVAKAINSRFSAMDGSRKVGAAVAKDNRLITLKIPTSYSGNLGRFFQVIAAVPVNENASERTERLQLLAKQLLEPSSSGKAAIALEAAGKDAIALLEQGLGSPRPEVAFYAAEALAYLDEKGGVQMLRNAARDDARFRWHAITALSAMTHIEAYEALSEMLQDTDPETKYGAFRALRQRNENDPFIRGEKIRDEFHFHVVTSLSAPMVHFSRRERAEIVVFGHDQRIQDLKVAVFCGPGIMLKPMPGGGVLVTRFAANKDDRRIETSGELVEAMKAVVEVGGGYEELLAMAKQLKKANAWPGELVVDALPTPTKSSGYNAGDSSAAATPFPSLFDPDGNAVRRDSVRTEEYDGGSEETAKFDEANVESPETADASDSEEEETALETAAKAESGWSWWPSWY